MRFLTIASDLLTCRHLAHASSISGVSTSLEHTQKVMGQIATVPDAAVARNDVPNLRVMYLVYTRVEGKSDEQARESRDPERVIGICSLNNLKVYGVPFGDHLHIVPKEIAAHEKVLMLEAGWQLLPTVWGKGYCPEAVTAMLSSYHESTSRWNPPYQRVCFVAVVGEMNPRSQKVASKVGFTRLGIHEWEGDDTFLGGAMQPPRAIVFGLDPESSAAEKEVKGK